MTDDPQREALLPRAVRGLGDDRTAAWAHYVSLALAGGVLAYLGRNMWFWYDEWAWIWQPENELWSGHVGHWSTVPILIWMAMQATLGLSSYAPFLLLEIATHLVTAHLLWRLTRRVGASAWLATGLVSVFLLLGAGAQNLFWAFQYAYIGSIACGLGAVLLALRRQGGVGSLVGIAGLLSLGAANAGTVLPFFVPVALILWRTRGLRATALTLAVPTLLYAFWVVFVAGPSEADLMRARGVDVLLVPLFAGSMYVEGLGNVVPLPWIGAVLVGILVIAVFRLLRRGASLEEYAVLVVTAAGALFSILTGFSRWNLGLQTAEHGRYTYFLCVTLMPLAALLTTRLVRGSALRAAAVALALLFVGVYNVGTLVVAARSDAARAAFTHETVSAGLDLLDRHPGAVDTARSPDPVLMPAVTIGDLAVLRDVDDLRTIPFGEEARLTALVNVGLTLTPTSNTVECGPLPEGARLASGAVLVADDEVDVTIVAVDGGAQGRPRTLTLQPGAWEIAILDGARGAVEGSSGPIAVCEGTG